MKWNRIDANSRCVVWAQIVGLIAATILLFVAGYVLFQRQEVRAQPRGS
jgi:ABC-2 type transport system permease protein